MQLYNEHCDANTKRDDHFDLLPRSSWEQFIVVFLTFWTVRTKPRFLSLPEILRVCIKTSAQFSCFEIYTLSCHLCNHNFNLLRCDWKYFRSLLQLVGSARKTLEFHQKRNCKILVWNVLANSGVENTINRNEWLWSRFKRAKFQKSIIKWKICAFVIISEWQNSNFELIILLILLCWFGRHRRDARAHTIF